MSGYILADLRKALDICVAVQDADPKVIARGEADSFRTALMNAAAELDACVRIAARNNGSHARSESTAGGEAPVSEPTQATVGSDEQTPSA